MNDTEGSTKHMNVSRLPNPQSWMELLEEINYVIQNPGCCKTLTLLLEFVFLRIDL